MSAEALEQILSHELTSEARAACELAVNKCEYATTYLLGLYMFLLENDDQKGAALVFAFLTKFAEHEATVV